MSSSHTTVPENKTFQLENTVDISLSLLSRYNSNDSCLYLQTFNLTWDTARYDHANGPFKCRNNEHMMPLSLYTDFRLHPGGTLEATYMKENQTQETPVVHRYDRSEFCINIHQLQVEAEFVFSRYH